MRVVVEVMLKPEILDPQGAAVLAALPRLGMSGVRSVRLGKRFELDVDGEPDLDQVHRIAHGLLSNPVIENYTVHLPGQYRFLPASCHLSLLQRNLGAGHDFPEAASAREPD